jgi:GNAT superfamily N-acetyltransferase
MTRSALRDHGEMAQALSSFDRGHRHVIEPRPYDHPDVRHLTGELYLEQLARYGFADAPDDSADDFAPPQGLFLVAYAAGLPCACGGIRTYESGVAEIKKMYVTPAFRGQGLGHRILAELEQADQANGAHRFILETGSRNTEALALYVHAGYRPIPAYRERDSSINRALAKNAPAPKR